MTTESFISSLALPIGIVGVVVICWGVLLAAIDFLYVEYSRLRKRKPNLDKNQVRMKLGRYTLLGLEFMIAGDIMHTVVKPTKDALLVLAVIVSIRTVISFFLRQELKDIKKK